MTAALALGAYLVGSIPFAWWLTVRSSGRDIRRAGSGSLGATNVWRVAGGATALAVLVLDVGKGVGAVAGARAMGADLWGQSAAATAVVVGQVFPVWLRGSGGKGVATSAGALTVLTPWPVLIAGGIFLAAAGMTRFISVGSLAAATAIAPLVYVAGAPFPVLAAAGGMCLLIVFQHRANLTRLRAGREPRWGSRA